MGTLKEWRRRQRGRTQKKEKERRGEEEEEKEEVRYSVRGKRGREGGRGW